MHLSELDLDREIKRKQSTTVSALERKIAALRSERRRLLLGSLTNINPERVKAMIFRLDEVQKTLRECEDGLAALLFAMKVRDALTSKNRQVEAGQVQTRHSELATIKRASQVDQSMLTNDRSAIPR